MTPTSPPRQGPRPAADPDLVDRLVRLRTILPLIAAELAEARRRAHALERENRRLAQRVKELESAPDASW